MLNALTSITTFLFGLWLFTLTHAYLRRVIHGQGWLLFLLCAFICTGGAYASIYLLKNPIFVPETEQVQGLPFTELFAYFYKAMGALITLTGLVAMLLTLMHYILHINVVTYGQPWPVTRWVLRKTYVFADPLRMGVAIVSLLIVACFFSSGYVYYLSLQR